MSGKSSCTIYIGNLDERVTDRVLYDILIQAGRLVDLYIPREKETDKPKGYAFAEYETEEIAGYAVRLFTGLVTLYNRTLKFAISGQDKQTSNVPTATTPYENPFQRARSQAVPYNNIGISNSPTDLSTLWRGSAHSLKSDEDLAPPGVMSQSNGRSNVDMNSFDYRRIGMGTSSDSMNRSRSRRHDASSPVSYHPY